MKRSEFLVAIVGISLAPSAHAEDEPKLSFDFRGIPLQTASTLISKATGKSFALGPGASGNNSASWVDLPLSRAIDALIRASSVPLTWRFAAETQSGWRLPLESFLTFAAIEFGGGRAGPIFVKVGSRVFDPATREEWTAEEFSQSGCTLREVGRQRILTLSNAAKSNK